MYVISIVQQKGGVGKTTLAVNLAGEIKARGHSVVVADADPQGSAAAWSAPRRLEFEVRPQVLEVLSTAQWIRNVLKQKADYIIVDTPAGLGPVFNAAVDVADLVLVPCGPSSLDLSAARTTLTAVSAASRRYPNSHARIIAIPTRVESDTPEGQQIRGELQSICELVSPSLSHDMYFVRAFTQGVAVCTAAPASRAASETRDIVNFLLGKLNA